MADKIADVRTQMQKEGADIHILSSLYDIAWLLNLRGGDIDHVPVFLSFVSIEKEQILLFVNPQILRQRGTGLFREEPCDDSPI